jgi:hypothetical protein
MSRLRSAVLVLGLWSLAACGDDGTGPEPNPYAAVAGTYHATDVIFTPTGSGGVDVLDLGGSLDVVLTLQGTTTGTLVVPPPFSEDGVNNDLVDLTGTYTITGNTLAFEAGDSFLSEVPWFIGNGVITTTSAVEGGIVAVTLTRS